MILMSLKKKRNKKFYSLNTTIGPHTPPKVYLVYRFDPNQDKIMSDAPYGDAMAAKEAMEVYLSQGLCAWIATYNE